jgi:hypothetical protein
MHEQTFAYGSLVNAEACPAGLIAVPAILSGWSREWTHRIATPKGKVCALSAVPEANSRIKGVVLCADDAEAVELDEREIDYRRVPVTVQTVTGPIESPLTCFMYVGADTSRGPATRDYPIWRSYLDCVLSGYIALDGPEAADEFVRSTRGWPAPILDDRDSPKYPRAVRLTRQEKEVIDGILRKHLMLRGIFSKAVRREPN